MTDWTSQTAFVTDDQFFAYEIPSELAEWFEGLTDFDSPVPKGRLLELVRKSGLAEHLMWFEPGPVSEKDLLLFHTPEYIALVQQLSSNGGGEAGDFATVIPGLYEIALSSVGAAIQALHVVGSRQARNAYALMRPPGHHAEPTRGRGYCIFGNIPIAIRASQNRGLFHRACVIDLDVHHGNGTQVAFWEDPSVLSISVHQDRCYPEDSGMADEIGEGAGEGYTVNLPLPPGGGRGIYERAFADIIAPAVHRFQPEILVIAMGYDAGGFDPLGRMMLSADAYGSLTNSLIRLADEVCSGKLVAIQEGGYSPFHVPFCGLRVLEAMTGFDTGIKDPFDWLDDQYGQELSVEQERTLKDLKRAHSRWIAGNEVR